MADNRTERAWRTWVADQGPTNAQAYCTEILRSGQQPCTSTPLEGLELSDGLDALLSNIVEKFLGLEFDEALLEDLHWITENHVWAMGGARPSAMRALKKLYSDHGMELEEGVEEVAVEDMARASDKGGPQSVHLRQEARIMENKVQDLEGRLKMSKNRATRLEREARRFDEDKVDRLEVAGLRTNYDRVKSENERLTKLLQAKK